MAILGFHFSGVYKEDLLNGNKTATVMNGENYFSVGQEVLIYLSNEPNLFEGKVEKRIGRAIIQKVDVKKVRNLTESEAGLCGSDSLSDLKDELKKWYDADEDSTITYVKFDLELED